MENNKIDLKKLRDYVNEEFRLKADMINALQHINLYKIVVECTKESLKNKKDACEHDLILYLGKENIMEPNVGLAFCLTCGEKFYMKDEEVLANNVINVDGIINPIYICAYENNENILVMRAQTKALALSFTNQPTDIEEVKQNILEDLVCYTDELEYKKIKPRKRARVLSEEK